MTFNGIEYTIKDNSLAIDQASIPLLVKYRKLRGDYLDDIDTSAIQYYDKQIDHLETAISQLKALDENDIFKDEQTNGQRIIELETQLKEVKEQKANDEEVQIISKMRNDIEALILTELALDTELMGKLFSKILIGDLSKIDYKHTDYKQFAVNVLVNFFLIMQSSKQK